MSTHNIAEYEPVIKSKPNEDQPLHNQFSNGNSANLLNPLEKSIFGCFSYLAIRKPERISKSASCAIDILSFLVLLLLIAPLFIRTFAIIGDLNATYLFSRNWAITLAVFLLSLHSIASAITLFVLAKTSYFSEFTRQFAKAISTQNALEYSKPTRFRAAKIWLSLFAAVFIVAFGLFFYDAFERSTIISETRNITELNSIKPYQKPFLGWYELDALVITEAVLASISALVIYNFAANALAVEYTKFNEDLKAAAEAGELGNVETVTLFGRRHLHLLQVSQFAFSKFGPVVTFTLIGGLLTHIGGGFLTRTFAAELTSLDMAVAVAFMILGIALLMADVKRVSDFAGCVDTTKNILLFNDSIYSGPNSLEVSHAANNIVFRIASTHFLPTAFSSFKINEKFFQRAFLLMPFIIEFLNAHKVVVP